MKLQDPDDTRIDVFTGGEYRSRKSDNALNPDPYAGQLERCGWCGKRGTRRWLDEHGRNGMPHDFYSPDAP